MSGSRSGNVSQHRFREVVQVPPPHHIRQLILYPRLRIREKNRNSIDYRVLALAKPLRTDERSLHDLIAVKARHMRNLQYGRGLPSQPAVRAERLYPFAVFETQCLQPPTITVGEQGGIILPVGLGIGATQPVHETMSPKRAAGRPTIITDEEPFATIPGPFGVQVGIVQGLVWVVTVAASSPLMTTVVFVAVMSGCGIGGCASGVGTGPGG